MSVYISRSWVAAELFLHLISHSKRRSQIDQIFDAMSQAEGAFSCVVLTDDCLVAVRDPNGLSACTYIDAVITYRSVRDPNGLSQDSLGETYKIGCLVACVCVCARARACVCA